MGFIQAELDKDKQKFISLEQIVLYVQSLDSNKSSLADTAKFLLRRYNNDIPFMLMMKFFAKILPITTSRLIKIKDLNIF